MNIYLLQNIRIITIITIVTKIIDINNIIRINRLHSTNERVRYDIMIHSVWLYCCFHCTEQTGTLRDMLKCVPGKMNKFQMHRKRVGLIQSWITIIFVNALIGHITTTAQLSHSNDIIVVFSSSYVYLLRRVVRLYCTRWSELIKFTGPFITRYYNTPLTAAWAPTHCNTYTATPCTLLPRRSVHCVATGNHTVDRTSFPQGIHKTQVTFGYIANPIWTLYTRCNLIKALEKSN
jgi:hypothetical protein